MKLIDTHAHLYASQFSEDINQVISRAKSEGVKCIYLPNIDEESINPMYDLMKVDDKLFVPMMGLHPCSVTEDYKTQLAQLKSEFKKHKFAAVGEIGIDLYWDKSLLKEQQEAFAEQVQWSIDMELPFAIHARDSFQEIFDVLKSFDATQLKGVFHCFTGTMEDYKTIEQLGDFYIGVGGVVTYKKSHLPDVLEQIPLNRIVLETDAPYLAPVPKRGKRNESAYLIYIAEKLSEIYNCSLKDIGETTSANAEKLFGN